MAFNRDSALRKAEKLLKQGRLDAAIAEYAQVVKNQPKDWNTANILGDLYVRARQVDEAVKQYVRIADHLAAEGFYPRAAAVYKKILKIKADEEHASLQLAEVASKQGLLADARSALQNVVEQRKARGDRRGAAEILRRLGTLDPSDVKARLSAARAAAELGETPEALEELKALAEDLKDLGRPDDALKVLTEAAELSPGDREISSTLMGLYLAAGDLDKARRYVQSADELLKIAADLEAGGKIAEALEILSAAVAMTPDDAELNARVVQLSLAAGDLARAREYARTPVQLKEIAAGLHAAGRTDEAIGLLAGLVAASPDDAELAETVMAFCLEVGDLAGARQYARTSAQLVAIADQLQARGDTTGAIELLGEVAAVTPENAELGRRIVGLCLEAGELATARQHATTAEQLKHIAVALQARGETAAATELLAEAAALDPADTELSEALLGLYLQAGDADKARRHARTTDHLRQIAAGLEERGQAAQALELLAEVAEHDPSDIESRAKLARAYLAEQDAARAHQYLTREVAGTDADLLWALAEAGLRSEEPAEGLLALRDLLAAYPERHHHVVLLGCSVASVSVDTAYQVIDLATNASVERGEWADAAAALNEFVNREPGHVPALMRLVEICVDGGLEATMFSAQGQLVDAYLAAGQGAEARTIAEDLVAREPWDRANIERFRRALTQLGEKNIDQTIADRLSGEMPFVSTALSSFGDQEDFTSEPPMGAASTPAPPAAVGPAPPADDGQTFEMGAAAIDIGFLADRTEPTDAVDPSAPPDVQPDSPALPERQPDSFVSPAGEPDSAEVDLSQALEEMNLEPAGPEPGPSGQAVAQNIDEVFQDFRDEVSRENLVNVAVQHQKLAQMYLEMGLEEEAVKSLEVAVRAPPLRFEAASMLARLCLKRGAAGEAIDWFERAAEAPASSPDDGRALLYDLADTLEAQGETARALAVFLELQADAGEYRDLASRLQRLTNAQTQG